MLVKANIFLYLLCALLVLISGELSFSEFMLVGVALFISWFVTHVAVHVYPDPARSSSGLLSLFVIVFYLIAYVSKLPLAVYIPESFWVTRSLISEWQLREKAPISFIVATGGYVCLMMPIIIFSRLNTYVATTIEVNNSKFRGLVITCVILVIMKYILKDYFNIGVPGREPAYLGIPMLSGFLALLISTGNLLIINILVFYAIVAENRKIVVIGLLLVLVNMMIDLMFGAKMTLVYQVVVLVYYYYMLVRFPPIGREWKIRTQSKYIGFFVVLLCVFILQFYKYINYYRFALLNADGQDIDLKVMFAALAQKDRIAETSSFMEIYNRISGLEVLSAVMELKDLIANDKFHLSTMVDGSLVTNFTYIIMGTTDANTAFGTTQFGYFYAAGGYTALFLGMFIIGVAFCLLQKWIVSSINTDVLIIALLPVWCLLAIKLLLGPGDLILWGKEVFLFILILKVGEKTIFRQT